MSDRVLPELNGVRAISIALVLAAHMLPLGPAELGLNGAAAPLGMSLFFCLSGFLITMLLYESGDVADFFRRRFARIVPLAFVYSFFVAGLLAGRWDAFGASMLFFLNYDDSALGVPAFAHLWSLSVEVQFYVAIGLLVLVFGKRAFWAIPIAAVAVMILKFQAGPGAYANIRTHFRVDEILSGSMVALTWLRRPTIAPRVATVTFWVSVPLWMASSHPFFGPLDYFRPYFAAALVWSSLYMSDGMIRGTLRTRPLEYVAGISYSLYVWHPLMMLGWLGAGDKIVLYAIKRPISFALTFLVAHLSTNTLERYSRRLARTAPRKLAPLRS